jgi:hypothetical protein
LKKFFVFLGFLLFLNHFLYFVLISYVEKTSYLWHLISKREILEKDYTYLILGDSQVMSGIHPKLLKAFLIEETKILYYPRPSEQAEGIYLLLKKFYAEGYRFKKILVNISPVTTSKNNIVESHKTLTYNFFPFHKEIFLNFDLSEFYFKNLSGAVYYCIVQIFPLLKLNSNLINELALIPKSASLGSSLKMSDYLDRSFFGDLQLNHIQNTFLKNTLSGNEFYFQWDNFKTTNICIPNLEEKKIPFGIKIAFSNPRKKSFERWLEIYNLAKENMSEVIFLNIPFSPEIYSKILEGKQLPLHELIRILDSRIPKENIFSFPVNNFLESDFSDYTHLNYCGMKKLTKELANKLNKLQ